MKPIRVDTVQMNDSSASMHKLAAALRENQAAIDKIHLHLGLDVFSAIRLKTEIKTAAHQILNEAARMDSLASALECLARNYEKAEKKSADGSVITPDGNDAVNDIVKATEKLIQQITLWLMSIGLIKAEKQERIEGEPVSKLQERAMDMYMKQEIDKILKNERFSEATWRNASVEERKKILQEYIVLVGGVMGLPAVTIQMGRADYREPEGNKVNFGAYRDGDDSIHINPWVIENGDAEGFNSYRLLSTVAHEMRHYYQKEATRHPDQYVVSEETVKSWEDSFNNYKLTSEFMKMGMNEDEAFQAYRNQTIERDARWFANQD